MPEKPRALYRRKFAKERQIRIQHPELKLPHCKIPKEPSFYFLPARFIRRVAPFVTVALLNGPYLRG